MEKEKQTNSTAKAKKPRTGTKETTKTSSKSSKPRRKKSKAIGVGDVVEQVAETTGIKKAVNKLFGEDCGCEKRKDWLNKNFGFYNEMSEEHKALWSEKYTEVADGFKMDNTAWTEISEIYSAVFGKRFKRTRCTPCIKRNIGRIQRVYELCSD